MSDVTARISRLFVYPVKSCAGIPVERALLTRTGLAHDRTWMVVDQDGEMISQRDFPRMCLIQPVWQDTGVQLNAPGMQALLLPWATDFRPAWVRVWQDRVSALDAGQEASDWITDYLGANMPGPGLRLRIVRFDNRQKRRSDSKWTQSDEVLNHFSDGFPLLVVSQASLDELNGRLAASGKRPVTLERFRPNLVLDGVHPHDEDRVQELTVHSTSQNVTLRLCKPCARCSIPNIDPLTSISTTEVGDVLQTYRSDARLNGAVTFGMNAYEAETGSSHLERFLSIGDRVWGDFNF